MAIFERIDSWVGRNLFVPLVIRWCQQFGVTQHRVHRVCWFIAALIAFYFADSTASKILLGCFAVLMCVVAGLVSDHTPATSWRWFRLMIIAFFAYHAFRLDYRPFYDLLVLVAEYASTIRTIQPLEASEPKAKLARESA
jgi:uncharacterized membrane protein YbaN (DUF454 family)